MEYRNGTLIFGPAKCADCSLSNLTAHEFFHLWNAKRLRPASLEPLDHARPMPSPSLWFVEGVTSTFAEFIRLRSGAATGDEFLSRLGKRISRYRARPARLEQSAEQGSVEAWLEGYPEYGSPQRSVSYYLRGELIGYLLDLSIRRRTKNRRSLDDVLRLLNERYAVKGRFYDDTDAIEQAVSAVAGSDMSAVVAAPGAPARAYRLERLPALCRLPPDRPQEGTHRFRPLPGDLSAARHLRQRGRAGERRPASGLPRRGPHHPLPGEPGLLRRRGTGGPPAALGRPPRFPRNRAPRQLF